ncbi:ras guanyl-nucleotide exchange factor [Colletotrichum karsti]|uniref:Ras guanyl-nucleotide exchange factor n=1 Tax=Colletotrichum karsti TaxID=1095194 RepID=A0A9P6LKC4_9PEZI|nr:ras guanyl-nucleotide exchange factor [Colletotrichum karsti]KAF9876031.1 ras guanyl-nucleotide exchange factor [Colletotrichum karsti]
MTTAPRLRSIYRSLLRELPPRPVLARERSSLHSRLRGSFAAATNPRPDTDAAEAEQFAAYLRAQRTYVTLLERYNPGMNMDEEERVRLTARRVGMDLPVEFKNRLDKK